MIMLADISGITWNHTTITVTIITIIIVTITTTTVTITGATKAAMAAPLFATNCSHTSGPRPINWFSLGALATRS